MVIEQLFLVSQSELGMDYCDDYREEIEFPCLVDL
jgi:hypothetical protein